MFLVLLKPVSRAEFKYVCIIGIGNQIREIFTADSRCRVKCRSGPIFTLIFPMFRGSCRLAGRFYQRASLGFFLPFLQADRSAYQEFRVKGQNRLHAIIVNCRVICHYYMFICYRNIYVYMFTIISVLSIVFPLFHFSVVHHN